MECCKASQFSNDAGARIWQAADVGYLALQYGAWLTWACLTLQLSSHLVPLLLQESSLHFLSFFVKTFLVYFIFVCVCVGKNTAVCCLTARKSPRNSSLPIGSPSETRQELRCGTGSRSIPAQSKANNLLSFTE